MRSGKILNKKGKLKYGKLSTKKVKVEPWAQVDIYLIGPYIIKINEMDSKSLSIELTMVGITFIDHAAGWFEITEVPYKDHSSARNV